MFQFPGFASRSYVFTTGYLQSKWVSPFGNLRFSVCLPTYRSLSQATTSFIAFCRQGIHHMRLVTWSYNLKRFHAQAIFASNLWLYSLKVHVFLLKNTVFVCNLIVKER